MSRPMLTVGMAPHQHGGRSIPSLIRWTFFGLLPVIIAALYLYRGKALAILVVAVVSAVATEAVITAITRKKQKILDGHSALLGTLLALIMPPGVALWIVMIAAILCVALGKMVFGNAWNYPFHPVLVAWVLIQMSWKADTENYYKPLPMLDEAVEQGSRWQPGADPLAASQVLPAIGSRANMNELFWGDHPGAIGTTSVAAILLGALILIGMRIIPWQVPVGFLGAAWLFGYVFHQMDPMLYPPPSFSLMIGGLFFAAVFLATEWVTSPVTGWGMLLYGIGAGVLTLIIRYWGTAGEGAYFAILIMNAATPLFDRIAPIPFGRRLKANA